MKACKSQQDTTDLFKVLDKRCAQFQAAHDGADQANECSEAFEGSKTALTNAPVLALPESNSPFEVICDACGVSLGAVLVQWGRPIAFEGKRLSEAEQKYITGQAGTMWLIHSAGIL
ncbi:hypothetical protein WJX77_002489 [Trebouxia sp. C0004]